VETSADIIASGAIAVVFFMVLLGWLMKMFSARSPGSRAHRIGTGVQQLGCALAAALVALGIIFLLIIPLIRKL
jgi:hypothetical protein